MLLTVYMIDIIQKYRHIPKFPFLIHSVFHSKTFYLINPLIFILKTSIRILPIFYKEEKFIVSRGITENAE